MKYLLTLTFAIAGCTFAKVTQPENPIKNEEIITGKNASNGSGQVLTDASNGYPSLLGDPLFEKGFVLRGNNSSHPGTHQSIHPFGEVGGKPVWNLAEWGSKYSLQPTDFMDAGGVLIYQNEGKLLSFDRKENEIIIRMGVNGSTEYERPRQLNEDWTHLLIEQEFPEKPGLNDLDSLILLFEGRLTRDDSYMSEEEFNPGLHTAQFQIFVTIQDLNKNSVGYGDFLWFGVPFYDLRYREIKRYAARDIGKDDATGKFIFSLATKDFMTGSFHDKTGVKVRKNLKPMMDEAVQTARERGYLKNSNPEDLHLSGMNLGWEVPGTFDVEFEFRQIDLRYFLTPGVRRTDK